MNLSTQVNRFSRPLYKTLCTAAKATTTTTGSRTSATPVEATPPVPSHRPHHSVLSLAGRDSVGIVRTVTAAISMNNANLEGSKMALLGGDFAMIAHITSSSEKAAESVAKDVREALPSFSISVHPTTARSEQELGDGHVSWDLELEGPDQPGIVAAVTQALATNGANVHELDTSVRAAPFAGYEMFCMQGQFSATENSVDSVVTAMRSVEEKFGVTVVVTPADT